MANRGSDLTAPPVTPDRGTLKRFSFTKDGKIKWQEVRDLEQGWSELWQRHKKGASEGDLAKAFHTPLIMVRSILRRWRAVEDFPNPHDILNMRCSGYTASEIARKFNITPDDVAEVIKQELAQQEGPMGQYAIEIHRCEKFFKALDPLIAKGNRDAILTGIRISEHKLGVIQTQLEMVDKVNSSSSLLRSVIHDIELEDLEEHKPKELTHEEPKGSVQEGSRRSLVESLDDDGEDEA